LPAGLSVSRRLNEAILQAQAGGERIKKLMLPEPDPHFRMPPLLPLPNRANQDAPLHPSKQSARR